MAPDEYGILILQDLEHILNEWTFDYIYIIIQIFQRPVYGFLIAISSVKYLKSFKNK